MITRRSAIIAPAILAAPAVQAQAWPARAIRMIVPWPPGQATDLIGRLFAEALTQRLGVPVTPENRAGAGGTIGTDVVAKAAGDGYTLLAASAGPVTISPVVQRVPYDVARDLAPIALGGTSPYVLVTHPNFPAQNLPEFIARVRAAPGRHTFASSGTGATAHLINEFFNFTAGIEAVHVPFQGSTPAITAILGGQVDYTLETAAATMPHVRGGRLRGYGVSLRDAGAITNDLPTFSAFFNNPGFHMGAWIGLMAPASTPAPIQERLARECMAWLATPEARERFATVGLAMDVRGPAEFANYLASQRTMFTDVVRRANIRAE